MNRSFGVYAQVVLLFLISRLFVMYMGFEPEIAFSSAVAAGLFALGMVLPFSEALIMIGRLSRLGKAFLICFCGLFSASVVLGRHICITGSAYSGTAAENYISPYSVIDLFAWVTILAVSSYLIAATILFIRKSGRITSCSSTETSADCRVVGIKGVAVLTLALLVMWTPWLMKYWPGFVFEDTVNSLLQIDGTLPLNNHHPLFFTGLIWLSMKIGRGVGLSTTASLGLYTSFQMMVMALSCSYLTCWMRARFNFNRVVLAIFVAVIGLSPLFATFSIALWKDPVFTAGIIVLTTMVADCYLPSSAVSRRKMVAAFLVMMVVALVRSNGVLVDAGVCFCASVALLRRDDLKRVSGSLALCAALAVASSLIITGPVYSRLGVIPTERAEGYGIPLNQMARVVALGGDMSEDDREYMDSIIPLEQYPTKYRPACTDLLKWDPEFNGDVLENGFWKHWVSMFIKNPRVYFEAWELQTFGYWTVNVDAVNEVSGNITWGVPYLEGSGKALPMGIVSHSLLPSADDSLFPLEQRCVPSGAIFWLCLALFMLSILTGDVWITMAAVPMGAVYASLFVASPIWYWPRYAMAGQFLIPLFIFMLLLAAKGDVFLEDSDGSAEC